ncbi:SdpI family protein [Spirosoma rigui]|uniref:SdpI family protein n=1 Tax=Spirosoma rigui TaxID=564064 RepID=UPI0009B13745|nr:SdpI family protein [Spirosoma rigui]
MKPINTSREALMMTLVLAPLLYLGISWNQLPTTMATQYDLQGNPTSWMPKETTAVFIGALSVLMYVLLRYLPRIDPTGNPQPGTYQKLRLVVTGMLACTLCWVIYVAVHSVGPRLSVNVLLVLISLLLAGMGNYLTTVKPNYFVGFRTPWTLHSDTVWRQTHQLGGRMLFGGGLLGVLLILLVPAPYQMGTLMAIVLVTTISPLVYSYVYFRREKAQRIN